MSKFSIIINTTDKFEDCWAPFFTLFKKFWPDYTGKIYLNTETKIFSFPNLNIIPVQNNIHSPNIRITWSECLIRTLDIIEDEIVLYLQEDYFLKDFVKSDIIDRYAQLIKDNPIDCIHLTDQHSSGPFHASQYTGLNLLDKGAPFRISCQAALWKKSILKSYLRKHENAWQFEEFGTKRSSILNHTFLSVDRNQIILEKNEIIPYIFTGIIQGKWKPEIVELFKQNNIVMDYNKRGFFERDSQQSIIIRIKRKFRKIPVIIISYVDLWFIRIRNKA